MTNLEHLLKKKSDLITEMQNFINSEDIDKANATKAKIDAVIDKINLQKFLDEQDKDDMKNKADFKQNTKENASFIRAALKKFSGKSLTEAENSLLLPSTTSPNGTNGEAYIMPQDIRTQINELMREFNSMRNVIGILSTTAYSGSFVVENVDSLAGLTSFTDGTEITSSEDPKFTQVQFTLKDYGALITLSNTLLQMTDNNLVSYIARYFAKKAVITENTAIVTALEKDKTAKTLTLLSDLKKSINKDLDPAALNGAVIVTNQDGFDKFDSERDTNGRPMLQPDPSNPTRMLMFGYPVIVFSNAMLKSTAATTSKAGYAPIFYGNLENAVKFVSDGSYQFATDQSAGFTKNVTIARIIEMFDVVQWDKSDKNYMYGQLEVEPKKTTA